MIERLNWHDVAKEMPDAGQTVLLWMREPKPLSPPGWGVGWWDDGHWCDSETGMVIVDIVTHWADPDGPGA